MILHLLLLASSGERVAQAAGAVSVTAVGKATSVSIGSTVGAGTASATGSAIVSIPTTGINEAMTFGEAGFADAAGMASYTPSRRLAMLLGGDEPSIAPSSLSISISNGRGTANFRRQDARSIPLSPLKIGIGSLSDPDLIFRGKVEDSTLVLQETNAAWDCVAVDSSFEFNSRLAWGFYSNVDAGLVARDLIAKYAPTFTSTYVQTGLAPVTIVIDGQTMDTVMNRLASAIGGYYYRDLSNSVHLFVTESPRYTPDVLDANNKTILVGTLKWSANVNQIRNRVVGIGAQTAVLSPLGIGETIIPVRDTSVFDDAANTVLIGGVQRVSYVGKTTGGGGSLVGPSVAPSTAPTIAAMAGAGIPVGVHKYAYTWVTAGGETAPSPLNTFISGNLAAPTNQPTLYRTNGGSLGIGTYKYAITYINSAGETEPSPLSPALITKDIPDPNVTPTVTTLTAEGGTDTFDQAGTYFYKYTYVTFAGLETLPSPASALYNPVGGISGVRIARIAVPYSTDVDVQFVRLYRTLNGGSTYYRAEDIYGNTGQIGNNSAGGSSYIDDAAADRWLTYYGAVAPATSTATFRKAAFTTLFTGPSGTTGRKIYRTAVNASQLKLLATVVDNTTTTYVDSAADASLGANAPTINTALMNQSSVTGIAVGPAGTLQRKVYRSAAGTSQLQLQQTIANNTTTVGTIDSTPDASLGTAAPTSDTSGLSTIIVTGQGFYTSGVTFPTDGAATAALTAAPLFTSASYAFVAADVGASIYIKNGTNWNVGSYLITGISGTAAVLSGACAAVTSPTTATWGIDYSSMATARLSWTDLVVDAVLATKMTSVASPFKVNCLGNAISILDGFGFTVQRVIPLSLSGVIVTCDKNVGLLNSIAGSGIVYGLPESQVVLAGSTTLKLASAGPFSTSGGWAILSTGIVIRYTGILVNTLTGIPNTGIGALLTSVPYGTQITPAPALTGVPAGGAGAIVAPISLGDAVALYCERNDTASQTAVAAVENIQGGTSTGVYEFKIQDPLLLTQAALNARCDADLLQYASVNGIVQVTYTTFDRKTLVGRPVQANWAAMGLVGTFIIQQVDIAFDEAGFTPPMFAVTASSVRFSLEDLLRHVVTA